MTALECNTKWTEREVWSHKQIVKQFLQDKVLFLNKTQLRKHIDKGSKADPINFSKITLIS